MTEIELDAREMIEEIIDDNTMLMLVFDKVSFDFWREFSHRFDMVDVIEDWYNWYRKNNMINLDAFTKFNKWLDHLHPELKEFLPKGYKYTGGTSGNYKWASE